MRHNRDSRHRLQEIDAVAVKGIAAAAIVHNERRINGHYYAIQRPRGLTFILRAFKSLIALETPRVRSLQLDRICPGYCISADPHL